MTSNF